MFVNFNKIFDGGRPTQKQHSNYSSLHTTPVYQYGTHSNIYGGAKDDSVNVNSDNDVLYSRPSRLARGAPYHHGGDKIVLSPSQCKLQPTCLDFFDPKNQLNVINLHLSDGRTKPNNDGLRMSHRHGNAVKNKTRATQTLFRESSAQTLPYLPGISNDPGEMDKLEIFKLPTILDSNGPPGLYEVEVLERARRRWMFAKALKENFCQQLEAVKEQAKLQKHEHILEAFEWEHWIEREENIQEYQMLRLDLLIRMFGKRERDMHVASKKRIQKCCQDIEVKRNAALKKNQTGYNRDIRRLNKINKNQTRVWRKETFAHELGDPTSEFYAPQMRYGVNPNRRHYAASCTGFDTRMNNLKTKAILMDPKSIKCPFSKLRQWSKPKQPVQEVEQNFCSDANLNKLYGSLKTLRESSKKYKFTPLCLKIKKPETTDQIEYSKRSTQTQMAADVTTDRRPVGVAGLSISNNYHASAQLEVGESYEEQTESLNVEVEQLQKEMRCEELETLISSYQGNTIGWLMRFLTEEMSRLKEQRKLQFLALLAKRKRWRREAAEAGLRQKENCMRETYEKFYEKCNEINKETTQTFLESILKTDIKEYARQKAEQDIAILARDLDEDISSWLNSFTEVQNPFNYQTLRQALKDIIMPDEKKMLHGLERDECIDYIMNDVLMNKVYQGLESYEISFSLASDFIDRLIDNDILLNSADCSSDSECIPLSTGSRGLQEAKAIMRKLLRRAVPGRRWLTEEERVTGENVRDLLDDVFSKVINDDGIIEVEMKTSPRTSCRGAHTDLVRQHKYFQIEEFIDSPTHAAYKDKVKLKLFNYESKLDFDDVTKALKWSEKLLLTDPDNGSSDDYVVKKREYVLPETAPKLSIVYNIPSYHDLSTIEIFRKTPTFAQTSSEELLEGICLEQEDGEDEQMMEDTLLLDELDFVEQSGCEEQHSEHPHEQSEQDEQEVKIDKDNKETAQQPPIEPTVQISDKSVLENVDAETVQEEDDTSSFMRVSFTYDPELNFFVAIPTTEDDDEGDR